MDISNGTHVMIIIEIVLDGKKSYKQPNSIRRKIRQYEMKLLRPKKISTLPAPDITGNLHGNDSKHEISLLNFLTVAFPLRSA